MEHKVRETTDVLQHSICCLEWVLDFFLRCGVFDRLYVQVCIQPIEMAILQYVPSLSRDVLPLHKTL